MSSHNESRIGDFRVICDRSGFKVWASETIIEWNGLRVCARFADKYRHPQDMLRGVQERPGVHNPRPESTDTYLEVGDVSPDDL